MNTITINGKKLAYEVRGTGEPVLLLHCGFVADSFVPLMNNSNLAGQYRLVNYHRVGYGQSDRASGPMSVSQQAADAVHCGPARHSARPDRRPFLGGVVALQLGRRAGVVHSRACSSPPDRRIGDPEVSP